VSQRRRSIRTVSALVLFAGLIAPSCGNSGATVNATSRAPRPIESALLPQQVLGLAVQREDIGAVLNQAKVSYVDSAGLYSFRRDEKLMATLQLVRMNALARPDDRAFRERMVNQVGQTEPRRLPVADTLVWFSTGSRERTASWFRDRDFFILKTRADFDQPRTLLRHLIDLRLVR
jgi:hypothetical protein